MYFKCKMVNTDRASYNEDVQKETQSMPVLEFQTIQMILIADKQNVTHFRLLIWQFLISQKRFTPIYNLEHSQEYVQQ